MNENDQRIHISLRELPPTCKGLLIAVEGVDGAGKSSVINQIKKWLEEKNYNVVVCKFRESECVKHVMQVLCNSGFYTLLSAVINLSTEFAYKTDMLILPNLKKGNIVLCDRYCYTTFAREAVRGIDLKLLTEIYSFAYRPNLVINLSIPESVAYNRIIAAKRAIDFWECGLDIFLQQDLSLALKKYAECKCGDEIIRQSFLFFLSKVKQNYEEIFQKEMCIKINAENGFNDVVFEVMQRITPLLPTRP